MTIRLLPYLTPYPQDLEHGPHFQEDHRQFTEMKFLPGHALLLQGFFSLLGPLHAFPPFWAALTIVLVLSCTPFPQDLEHFDHSLQEDFIQFTLVVLQDLQQFRFIQVA